MAERTLTPVTDGPSAPDHDEQAEQALLGTVLRHPQNLHHIHPGDLYDPRHVLIHAALTRLTQASIGITTTTLMHELRTTGDLDRAGGGLYLIDLDTQAVGDTTYWAKIVADHAHRRRLRQVATRMLQGLNQTTDPDQVNATAWDTLSALLDPTQRTDDQPTGRHDLTHLTNGQPPPAVPPPTCIQRADGHHLFYAARVNGIFGDPETAKTWLAQLAVIEALTNGQRATIVDVDHNGPTLTARNLLLLGAKPTQLADPNLFRYYEPDGPDELKAAVDELATWAPAVAILDSLGEMLPMLGVKSTDNDEITAALRRIANPLADAGACVITIDHLPKGVDARASGYAIGGTAKKRALDGVLLEAQAKKKPAPGQVGRITLRIHKDRPGRLREHSHGNYAGTFVLDSTNPHAIVASVTVETAVNDQGVFRPTHLMQAVSEYVEAHPWCTGNAIRAAVKGTEKHVTQAIDVLLDEEFLTTKEGPRKSTLHHTLALFTED